MSNDISKFQKFAIQDIDRAEIKNADYNPRKISEKQAKKLRDIIRKHGLVSPIQWNKRTGNIVGGHQRIAALDSLNRSQNYKLTVAVLDVSDDEEKRLNVILNNKDIGGEFDLGLLKEMSLSGLDMVQDLGFDRATVELDFGGDRDFDLLAKTPEAKERQAVDIAKLKEIKKQAYHDRKGADDHWQQNDDYMLTIVFDTREEKQEFMRSKGRAIDEKFSPARAILE